jgi:hypothetical protein
MTISYIWTINSMESYPQAEGQTDVVVKVNYSCAATDGTFSAAVAGMTNLKLDPDAPYTPYADLTEDQVVGWVKGVLGVEGVQERQNAAEQTLAYRFYHPVTLPNPWSVVAPEVVAPEVVAPPEVVDAPPEEIAE